MANLEADPIHESDKQKTIAKYKPVFDRLKKLFGVSFPADYYFDF